MSRVIYFVIYISGAVDILGITAIYRGSEGFVFQLLVVSIFYMYVFVPKS